MTELLTGESEDLSDYNIVIKKECEEEDEQYGLVKVSHNRNPPERCPRPLDPTQSCCRDDIEEEIYRDGVMAGSDFREGHNNLYQDRDIPSGNSSDLYVEGRREIQGEDDGVMEELSAHRDLYQDHTIHLYDERRNRSEGDIKEEEEDEGVTVQSDFPEGHHSLYQDRAESSSCINPHPVSQDSTEEDPIHTQHCQDEDPIDTVSESQAGEKIYLRVDQYIKESGITRTFTTEITTGGVRKKPSEGHLTSSSRGKMETKYMTGEKTTTLWSPPSVADARRLNTPKSKSPPRAENSTVVKEVKIYTCHDCGRRFMSNRTYVQHRKCHWFPCPECGKGFSVKARLDIHFRSHTGEKPHSCPECGKCFADPSALYRHQRLHTGEKLYSCTECGKKYLQKSALVNHQRSHTGEKPFFCSECGKGFSLKSGLNKHQMSHREKPDSSQE